MQTPVEVQLLMNMLMLLLVAAGCGWGVMAWLVKICPRASRFFAFSNVLILTGLVLLQQRTATDNFWFWQLSDLLILAGFLALYYGITNLYKTPLNIKLEWGFIALIALSYLTLTDGANQVGMAGIIFSLLSMLIFARCAYAEWLAVRHDFGLFYAIFFAAPLTLFSVFFGWRAYDTLQDPLPDFALLVYRSPESINQLWFFIILILILNFNLVGFAITRLVAKIRQLADKDWLTGVWSKRIIIQQLDYYIRDHLRNKSSFGILLLDLDHFKQVNDTYGHAIGDIVLQHATTVMQQQLRQSDWLGRFGGEEFVVILPDTEITQALTIAERLRSALQQHPLSEPIAISMTVSIGVTVYQPGQSLEQLLAQADQAMYQAKHHGRNAVFRG